MRLKSLLMMNKTFCLFMTALFLFTISGQTLAELTDQEKKDCEEKLAAYIKQAFTSPESSESLDKLLRSRIDMAFLKISHAMLELERLKDESNGLPGTLKDKIKSRLKNDQTSEAQAETLSNLINLVKSGQRHQKDLLSFIKEDDYKKTMDAIKEFTSGSEDKNLKVNDEDIYLVKNLLASFNGETPQRTLNDTLFSQMQKNFVHRKFLDNDQSFMKSALNKHLTATEDNGGDAVGPYAVARNAYAKIMKDAIQKAIDEMDSKCQAYFTAAKESNDYLTQCLGDIFQIIDNETPFDNVDSLLKFMGNAGIERPDRVNDPYIRVAGAKMKVSQCKLVADDSGNVSLSLQMNLGVKNLQSVTEDNPDENYWYFTVEGKEQKHNLNNPELKSEISIDTKIPLYHKDDENKASFLEIHNTYGNRPLLDGSSGLQIWMPEVEGENRKLDLSKCTQLEPEIEAPPPPKEEEEADIIVTITSLNQGDEKEELMAVATQDGETPKGKFQWRCPVDIGDDAEDPASSCYTETKTEGDNENNLITVKRVNKDYTLTAIFIPEGSTDEDDNPKNTATISKITKFLTAEVKKVETKDESLKLNGSATFGEEKVEGTFTWICPQEDALKACTKELKDIDKLKGADVQAIRFEKDYKLKWKFEPKENSPGSSNYTVEEKEIDIPALVKLEVSVEEDKKAEYYNLTGKANKAGKFDWTCPDDHKDCLQGSPRKNGVAEKAKVKAKRFGKEYKISWTYTPTGGAASEKKEITINPKGFEIELSYEEEREEGDSSATLVVTFPKEEDEKAPEGTEFEWSCQKHAECEDLGSEASQSFTFLDDKDYRVTVEVTAKDGRTATASLILDRRCEAGEECPDVDDDEDSTGRLIFPNKAPPQLLQPQPQQEEQILFTPGFN